MALFAAWRQARMKSFSIFRQPGPSGRLTARLCTIASAALLTSCGHSIDPDSISKIPTRATINRVDNSLDKLTAQHQQQTAGGAGELARQSQRDVDYLLHNAA